MQLFRKPTIWLVCTCSKIHTFLRRNPLHTNDPAEYDCIRQEHRPPG